MNFLQKILLRGLKGIELYGTHNLRLSDTIQLANRSILNAKNGSITLGKNVRIGNGSELVAGKQGGITIKDYGSLYSNCKILGNVTIERGGLLATNIYMSSGNHVAFHDPSLPIKVQDKEYGNDSKINPNKPIHIHEDVWIGNGVFIAAGITVGRGAIIGANSVITKDILPYKVVVGNPGRVIKDRLDFKPPSLIEAKNKEHWPYFYQGFDQWNTKQKNSLELVGEGIIHLTPKSETLTISGESQKPNTLTIIHNEIQTDVQVNNEFEISLNLKLIAQQPVIIRLKKMKNSSIFIHRISS